MSQVAKICLILLFLLLEYSYSQKEVNYDESKVPKYKLPEILLTNSGERVTTLLEWENIRRPEILSLFEENVYGKTPELDLEVNYKIIKVVKDALNGKAILKELSVLFTDSENQLEMNILIFLPHNRNGSSPIFLGLNFYGNHTIHNDTNITITNSWVRNNDDFGIQNNLANAKSRGVRITRWPVDRIIDRGYGIATIYYGDIDPDFDDGFSNGVHKFDRKSEKNERNYWGSIGAWAWGLSRAMDYFETDDNIDHNHVILLGHSRLGKTALWAGAQDERFAAVISNNSGCGGAALSKRTFGETVGIINSNFPHWFCKNFKIYNDNEKDLPVDQHMLLSLIAPRPLYVASAEEDQWADPTGEFLSLKYSLEAYNLGQTKKVVFDNKPQINSPIIIDKIGYHIRSGKHDVTLYDWECFMDFAEKIE
ncbi:MAG: hypothetical protein R3250_05245 [Melioribacteraceae bacterium]|nr:hypothetical protein [Melioribacteraceae bacterium]